MCSVQVMLSLVEKVFVLEWCTSMLSLVEKGFVLVWCVLCTSYVIFS